MSLMKDAEIDILNQYEEYAKTKLEHSKYEYEKFDASNVFQLVEIKDREAHYDSLVIEFDKFAYNRTLAILESKEFIYVNRTPKGNIYEFNISKLIKNRYNFRWEWRMMPKTSKFGNQEKVNKYVGYVDVKHPETRIFKNKPLKSVNI